MENSKVSLKQKIIKYLSYFFIGFTILLGVKTCRLHQDSNKLKQKLDLATTSLDTMTIKYNKGKDFYEYSKSIYKADNDVLKSELAKYSKSLDSLKELNPKSEVGFIADIQTKVDTVWMTDTITHTEKGEPVYNYTIKDELQEGTAIAYPDSLKLKLKLYTGLVGVLEDGKLKLTPTNKSVSITNYEGYQVTQPKKKGINFWTSFGIGVGTGLVGAIILTR